MTRDGRLLFCSPLVQKAVKELAAAMPEMEVLGADANQQEALFLINDTFYRAKENPDRLRSGFSLYKTGARRW